MADITPQQQVLADRLLELVRDERYHFVLVEGPRHIYATPWDVADDDWEEIENFDFGSAANLRAVVEHALLPLATDEVPNYWGGEPPNPKQKAHVFIALPRVSREPISASLEVFWEQEATRYYPPDDTHVHITKRRDGWRTELARAQKKRAHS